MYVCCNATMEKKKTEDSAAVRIDVLTRIIIVFIAGVIIGAVISQVGLEALQSQIQNIIFIFIWLIIIVGLVVYWVVRRKEAILKKLFGVSDTDLGELNKTAQSLLFNIVEKDYDRAKRDLSLLFRKVTAWYSWMNFRRWVIIAFQVLLVGFAGMLGTILLYNQNTLLIRQNELLNQQNIRLDQQTYLQEAERRSSLIFLMGNILDAVNQELKEDVGVKGLRDISPQLIGRVIALSNSLRPYRYLVGDSLVGRELSPERGYLLLAIVSSEIDKSSLRRIYKASDFSYADLKKAVLSNEYLAGINLTGADLKGALLDEADLSGANLSNAEMDDAQMTRANLQSTWFRNTHLSKANLVSAEMGRANLSGANLSRANLSFANMQGAYLINADLSAANLSDAVFAGASFDRVTADSAIVSEFNWLDSFGPAEKDSLNGANYLISNYYVDSVENKLGWFYLLLRRKK